MGVRIEKVDLPGIGSRHDLLTASGRRLCVVTERDGDRSIAFLDRDDPDSTSDSIELTEDEAAALADVLGASVMMTRLVSLADNAAGLFTEQVEMPTDSPFLNHPLGDTKARTRTRVSIVAVVRGGEVIPSPTPDEVLGLGDTLIAVGTREGLDALSRLIAHGPG